MRRHTSNSSPARHELELDWFMFAGSSLGLVALWLYARGLAFMGLVGQSIPDHVAIRIPDHTGPWAGFSRVSTFEQPFYKAAPRKDVCWPSNPLRNFDRQCN